MRLVRNTMSGEIYNQRDETAKAAADIEAGAEIVLFERNGRLYARSRDSFDERYTPIEASSIPVLQFVKTLENVTGAQKQWLQDAAEAFVTGRPLPKKGARG